MRHCVRTASAARLVPFTITPGNSRRSDACRHMQAAMSAARSMTGRSHSPHQLSGMRRLATDVSYCQNSWAFNPGAAARTARRSTFSIYDAAKYCSSTSVTQMCRKACTANPPSHTYVAFWVLDHCVKKNAATATIALHMPTCIEIKLVQRAISAAYSARCRLSSSSRLSGDETECVTDPSGTIHEYSPARAMVRSDRGIESGDGRRALWKG